MTSEQKRARPRGSDKAQQEQEKRRRNTEKVAVLGQQDSSVKILEELVFGGEDELLDRLLQEDDAPTYDPSISIQQDATEEEEAEEEEGPRSQPKKKRKAAWVDDDDELEQKVDMSHRSKRALVGGLAEVSNQQLQQKMRDQFQKVMGGTPSWAQLNDGQRKKDTIGESDEEDDDEDPDDLLRTTGNLLASSERLSSGVLQMKKCRHANIARPSEERLTSVQFHPSAQVVLTAGLDQCLSLFQVDGKDNPKIQSVHLDRFPVHKARFSSDGEMVMATSAKNRMFYLYHMIQGRVTGVHTLRGLNEPRVKEFCICPEGGAVLLTGTRGYVHLLELKTQEVVNSVKINGEVRDVAVKGDGSKVFVHSDEGQVHVWDVRNSGRCLNVFTDDGCVTGTSIASSPDGRFLACGSQSGVVNIYSQEACLNSANPKPLKAVKNLLTPATTMTFNPSSEILAIASHFQDEAVRLVHLQSLSVFSNFPVSKRKITYRTSCMDFSPHSGFFSLANNKGHAPLFRLLHYKSF